MAKRKAKRSTRTSNRACTLPDKPSQLILLALKDLKKVERNKDRYRVDMSAFHSAGSSDEFYDPATCRVTTGATHCTVCFAGAVIAGTLKAPYTVEVGPEDFPETVRGKLYALDSFRKGSVGYALTQMGVACDKHGEELEDKFYPAPDYDSNPHKFHEYMRQLAKELAKLGL